MNGGDVPSLAEMFATSRSRIVGAWLARTLDTYAPQTAHFFGREKDPFRNPVGDALRHGLPALFDELVAGMDPARLAGVLDPIVQIRAVQDFTPGQALAFLPLLKKVIRETVAGQPSPGEQALTILEARIDDLMLLAFDCFVRYRERIYMLRVNEARRSLSGLARINSDERPPVATAPGAARPTGDERRRAG